MNQSFYIGAVGAQQQLYHLNVHGDNIANVNTYGFKADRSYFTALMYQNHRGALDGQYTELPMGVGARMLITGRRAPPTPGGCWTTTLRGRASSGWWIWPPGT